VLGIYRAQREIGAGECLNGNIWNGEAWWAIQGLLLLLRIRVVLHWETSAGQPLDSVV
jgi:hypothetical protein